MSKRLVPRASGVRIASPLPWVSTCAVGRYRGRLPQRLGHNVLSALLALCLLVAQLGAAVHSISHLQGSVHSVAASQALEAGHGDAAGADELCLQCLAYAQIASVAPLQTFVAPEIEAHSQALPRYGRQLHLAVDIFVLARGPPHLV